MHPVGNATPGGRPATPPGTPAPPDLAAAAERPRAAWASADVTVVARTLQIVAESLWEAAGPRIGGWPVDAALGSDRTAGSAARRRFGRGGPVDLVALAAYFPQR